VVREEELDFIYEIRMRGYAMPTFAYPQMARAEDGDKRYYRAEVFMRRGGAAYDVFSFDQQEVIDDILNQFEKYMHFIHISPGILPWKMQEHDDMLNDKGEIHNDDLKTPS
jgi:choline/glycine/proline betaine transport protein